jgi:hypothetical protein
MRAKVSWRQSPVSRICWVGPAFAPAVAGRLAFVPALPVWLAFDTGFGVPVLRDARLAADFAMFLLIVLLSLTDVFQVDPRDRLRTAPSGPISDVWLSPGSY